MVEIVEVKTKKDKKKFIDFPTKLYKGVKQYVHPLRMSEFELFDPKKNASYKDCEVVYYLAYKDGKLVGRIAGILQKLYNAKVNEKRVRFTRFDCINDVEVAKALLNSVEEWAKTLGMNIVHGPMGFNDLDREGMLIEGFDEIATFEEAYNFEYYKDLMEACGYAKEVDWVEFNITIPEKVDEKTKRVVDLVKNRYHLRLADKNCSKKEFLDRYADKVFELVDDAYGKLYGVVPFTKELVDQTVEQFKLIVNLDFISIVLDENDDLVAWGLAFPSVSEVINKYEGRLTPFSLPAMIKAIKHPTKLDLGLIAVKSGWHSKGVPALIMQEMLESFIKNGIVSCETNLNLEYNVQIQQLWKNYEHRNHKRRRAWFKNI